MNNAIPMMRVLSRYEGRPYHNFHHVLRMMELRKELAMPYSQELDLAIVFHDVICEPGRGDNEIRSAHFMMDECKGFCDLEVLMYAYDMILDTRDHIARAPQSEYLIDLDLYDLGTDRFEANGKLIQQEYMRFTDYERRTGRKAWLEMMLERGCIFWSSFVKPELEVQARKNLAKELNDIIMQTPIRSSSDITALMEKDITAPNADGVVVPDTDLF